MKKIVCLLIVLVFGLSQEVCAQETAKEPAIAAEELSPEQFWEEFATALKAKNAARIQELITANPTTAEQIQQCLTELGGGLGEDAEKARAVVKVLEQFHSGDFSFMLNMLQEEGGQAYYASDYSTALEKFQAGLNQARALNDKRYISQFLTNIGVVYKNLGQYQRALEYHEQALAIHREIGNRRSEGADLSNIGLVYRNLGQYPQALEYFEQALMIDRELGDRRGEGDVLTNIGIVYNDLGQYPQALEYHEQALTIHREIGNRRGEGADLSNIGLVYRNLGQYSQALEYHEQALTIHREIGDRQGEGDVLSNIGIVYRNLGQYSQALEYYERALAIRREIGDRRGEGNTLTNIGNVYADLEQYQDAFTAFQDSLSIHEALGTLDSLWRAQCGLASVEVSLNQPESAITHYEQALDTIEALRAGLTEKEQKLSFMQNKLGVYDELIDLLQNLHKKHPDKSYDRKALEIFERKQGRMFLEEMGQSGARLFAGLPEAISQRELDLENQVEQTRKQLVDEHSKSITEQNKELIQTLEERENTLKAKQTALQEQIKTDYPEYYTLKYPKPASLAELQQKVLQPGELMLIYGVMEEKTLLWVIGSNPPLPLPGGEDPPLPPSKGETHPQPLPGGELRMYTLPVGEEELQQKVTELRQVMRYEYHVSRGLKSTGAPERKLIPFTQTSHALYTLLIPENVRSLLTEEHTLNIVPTGPLYALPFEALVTSSPGSAGILPAIGVSRDGETDAGKMPALPGDSVHYLIEDIPISYLSSASLLKTLREAQARRKTDAPYPLLAFAHPVYEPTPDPSQEGIKPTPGPSQEGNRGMSIQALCSQAYRDFMRGKFAELPETADEAEEIAKLLKAPKESEPLQLREDASRQNVFAFNTNDRLDDYQYIIFATHGVLPGEIDRVTQSALVLSHPDRDGYLTMADVFQLRLNAKFVSLSACNTGSGGQVRGEGVMGLTRAFMYAGTPAIAVTLWSVESFSAKALDIGLFRYLKDGQSVRSNFACYTAKKARITGSLTIGRRLWCLEMDGRRS